MTRRAWPDRIATVAMAAAALTLAGRVWRGPGRAHSAVGDALLPDLRTLSPAELYLNSDGDGIEALEHDQ